MTGLNGIIGNSSMITGGLSSSESAKMQQESVKFQDLIDSMKNSSNGTLSSSQISENGRLTGDYTSSFAGAFTSEVDKVAKPVGAAANAGSGNETIDRTSKLYEKSLELESYFVKMMLSSMRSTLSGSSINGEEKSYAQ